MFPTKPSRRIGSRRLGAFAVFALLAALSSPPARAIPEAGFDAAYEAQVMPFYKRGERGTFERKGRHGDRATIHYAKWEVDPAQERGALVVIPGRGEPFRKYAEVVYDLSQAMPGVSIYAMDPRGQGYSTRVPSNPQIGYVRDFRDYAGDLEQFMKTVVQTRPHRKTLLLAHSLGAALSTDWLQRYTNSVDAAVFSAPMYLLDTKPYSEMTARALSSAACLAGQGKKYALNQKDQPDYAAPEAELLTHSEARNNRKWRILHDEPELHLGGPSWRWVEQSLVGTRRILKNAEKLKTPVLILQAGEEHIVVSGRQNEVCSKAPDCRISVFEGSFHEILMERDPIRGRALREARAFFERHLRQ